MMLVIEDAITDTIMTTVTPILRPRIRPDKDFKAIFSEQIKKGDCAYSNTTEPSFPLLFHLAYLEFKRVGAKQKLDKGLLTVTPESARCLLVLGGDMTLKESIGKRELVPGNIVITTSSTNPEVPIFSHHGDVHYLRLTFSGKQATNALHNLSRTYGPLQKLPLNSSTFKTALLLTDQIRAGIHMDEFQVSAEAYLWLQTWWSDLDRISHAKLKRIRHRATPESLIRAGLFTVKSYAQYLGQPHSHLSEKLRKSWNTPPGAALYQARLQEAARLLKKTHLSVNDIAKRTGYSSASSFIRAFKTRYPDTPSDFRLREYSQSSG